jgi:hypothetical protein
MAQQIRPSRRARPGPRGEIPISEYAFVEADGSLPDQPLPKIDRWRDTLDQLLLLNEAEPTHPCFVKRTNVRGERRAPIARASQGQIGIPGLCRSCHAKGGQSTPVAMSAW